MHYPRPLLLSSVAVVFALAASPSAAVAASWGPPGFSAGWSPEAAQAHLVAYGVGDPMRNYFTPFWCGCGPNNWTGVVDTGPRNTFAINHDINASKGILGWLDVILPLFDTNWNEIGGAGYEYKYMYNNLIPPIADSLTGGYLEYAREVASLPDLDPIPEVDLSLLTSYGGNAVETDLTWGWDWSGGDWLSGGGGGGGGDDELFVAMH